jgi:hypothetical protein
MIAISALMDSLVIQILLSSDSNMGSFLEIHRLLMPLQSVAINQIEAIHTSNKSDKLDVKED